MDAIFTGKLISERRKALGLTQKELAEQIHVTDKAVSKWERGINFPDLGLMENLAASLDTTPAVLLGLENAGQDEIVSSITQISGEQLEDAQKELRLMGWGCIAASILLFVYNTGIGTTKALAYQILYCLIGASAIGGLYLLFKYRDIRKWNTVDWFVAYCAVIPFVIINGAYLFTDHGLADSAKIILTQISVSAVQLLFYRVMRPRVMKAFPMILTLGFALWHSLDGSLPVEFALPGIFCLITWLLCRRKEKASPVLPTKKWIITILMTLLILCVMCYSSLTQVYVKAFHNHLETYAHAMLAEQKNDTHYGFWRISVYPEDNMVQFMTGGSGLVSNSTYEGFYYSPENTHIPFQGVDVELSVNGDFARWTDGMDNYGTSIRLLENWFWFEAHF